MVDRSKDDLYTWTLEHEAMKQAGCCLTLFDPAKGAPEIEFELSRRELEPMDVTVGDEPARFEGGRILTLREAQSTRTWRHEQELHSFPAPPGEPGGFVFVWAGEVRLTEEDVDSWLAQLLLMRVTAAPHACTRPAAHQMVPVAARCAGGPSRRPRTAKLCTQLPSHFGSPRTQKTDDQSRKQGYLDKKTN